MASCFFCLQDSRKYFKSELDSDLSSKADPAFVDNLFPLRHISRFLNLFEDNDNDGENKNVCKAFKRKFFKFANDSMVSVCEDCSKMMKEFTELYHLMEVTKLRLNWCVQRMRDVMMKTTDKSTFLESENDENLLEVVRTKTMDRVRVMTSLPQVPRVVLHNIRKLPRIDMDHPPEQSGSTASPQPQPLPPDVGASITNLVKLLVSKPEPDQKCVTATTTRKTRAKSTSSNDEELQLRHFVKCSGNGMAMESPMEMETGSEDGNDNSREDIQVVGMVKHPKIDEMAGVSKPSDQKSSASPTKKRAKSFSKNEDEDIEELQQFVKCSHCRAKFNVTGKNTKRNREWLLRQHTLQYHCDVFFPHNKLDTVTDTQFKKILAELLFRDFMIENCHFCPKKFQLPVNTKHMLYRISKIKSHMLDFHFAELEEVLLKIQENPDLSRILEECNPSGKICRCGIYVASKDGEIRHDKFHCVLKKDNKPIMVPVPKSFAINFIPVPSKVNRVCCKLCGNEIAKSRGAKYSHWTYHCLGGLRRPSSKKKSAEHRDGPPTSTSCPYCRYKCKPNQTSASMRSHFLSFHPQYYFPHVEYQYQAITSDQFQKVIHDILFPELTSSVKGGIYSCPFCSEHFKGSDGGSLRRHLVCRHNKEVTDRLEVILTDPKLKRKLAKVNPDGVSCPCGMYLPYGIFFKENHHEKFQCNLKVTTGEIAVGDDDEVMDEIPSRCLLLPTSNSIPKKDAPTITKNKTDSRESTSANRLTLTSCPYCRYTCRTGHASTSMSRHLLRFHPQYYFPQMELEYQVHGNGVTSDMFQRVLHDILFPELTLETGGVFSCKFCDYSFKGKDNYSSNSSLRRHLVSFHINELKERLEVILADPGGLEGKLATVNTIGVSCPCGMYLPNGVAIGFSESFHDKFQCKLKAKEAETDTGVGISLASSERTEVVDDEDGGELQDGLGSESEGGDFLKEEAYKFSSQSETVQMTIDRNVNQMFVDESDPLEL